MASYGPVPRDENEVEAQAVMQGGNGATTSNPKQHPQAYVPVAHDEDTRPKTFHGLLSGLCIQPLLLVGLAVFFATSTLTVGLLYHFSQVNVGLTTESNSHRYAWLYGPTAVVVLVRVIWRVLDLKVKETMPWHELAHGPSPASKTVLLEYMSPGLLPSIWSSVKNRHWAVTTAIVGQSLLLLSTVFTTGLFTLEATSITVDNVSLRTNGFNGSAFNVKTLDASAALLSLAIQTQNLSYPKGTTSDTVVSLFESDAHYPADAVAQAVVKGVKVSFDCDTLDVSNATKVSLPWYSIRAPQFVINVTTPSCTILNARIGMGPDHGYMKDPNSTQTYQGWMDNYVCNSGLDESQPWGKYNSAVPQWSNDTRYLKSLDRTLDDRIIVSVVDFHYLRQKSNTDVPPQWVNRLTALLCKPSYEINEYRVDSARNTTSATIEFVKKTNETLDNFYPGDMSKSITKVYADYRHLYIGMGGVDFQFTSDAAQPFGQMMSLLHGGEKTNFTLKDLIEPDILKSSAQALLTGTMTQILHQKVMTTMSDTYNENIKGTLSYTKDRLHVKAVSAGFLCACFALLTVFAIALVLTAPRKPNIPGAIGSTQSAAIALQSNQVLRQVFLTTQPKGLKANLSVEFFTRPQTGTGTVGIDFVPVADKLEGNSSHASESDNGDQTPVQWWHPAISRGWYSTIAVVLCAIILGLLEGIQQISDKHDGFMNINPSSVNSTILSQYIPAAIVLSIALMFADMEKMVATFSPFATLKKGNAMASRTLTLDYLTRSGPHAFFLSIVNRHFALSIVLMTTFVGSFLAIVVPGLYSQHTIPTVSSVTLIKADHFNFTDVDISLDDRRAGTILNLLTYYDIAYPTWTYDDLVFPKLNFESMGLEVPQGANSSSAILRTRTTALRPKLTCQSLAAQAVWKGQPNSSIVDGIMYSPWSMCSNAPANMSSNGTTPWSDWSFFANDTIIPKQSYYFGQGGVMRWGMQYWSGPRNHISVENSEGPDDNIRPGSMFLPEWGCPSVAFALGSATFSSSASRNSSSIITAAGVDMNTIACWQNLQSVDTDVTLEYPSMAFVKDSPPQPDESTAKWLKNLADSQEGTSFQFVTTNMFISLSNPNISSKAWAKGDFADRFTQAVVYRASKEDGLSVKDLAGVANSEKFIKMVQKLYARYMVQAISNNMRVGVAEEASRMAVTDALWTATASPIFVPTPSPSSTPARPRVTTNTTMIWLSNANATSAANSFIKPTSVLKPTTLASNPTQTAASNNLRKRADNTIPAILTRTGSGAHVRLKQNRAPKIALQVMLAVMIVGALATKVLLRTKETLQREPYSIAGRAVLVANGDILETMDADGGENLVLDGKWYRLGWWEDSEGRKRYGITIER